MYKSLNINISVDNLHCVSYKILSNSSEFTNKYKSLFGEEVDDNTFVIYSSNSDTIEIFGKFSVDNSKIQNSLYYLTLLNNTHSFGITDKTQEFESFDGIHIYNWVFDECLRNDEWLSSIFNFVVQTNKKRKKKYFMWCDGKSDIIYYPINPETIQNLSPVAYFVTAFKNE